MPCWPFCRPKAVVAAVVAMAHEAAAAATVVEAVMVVEFVPVLAVWTQKRSEER